MRIPRASDRLKHTQTWLLREQKTVACGQQQIPETGVAVGKTFHAGVETRGSIEKHGLTFTQRKPSPIKPYIYIYIKG